MEDPDGYNKSASAARAGEPLDVTIHLGKAALGGLQSFAIPASYASSNLKVACSKFKKSEAGMFQVSIVGGESDVLSSCREEYTPP